MPISHIQKNLYLVGTQRLNCDEKFGNVFIKIGGGKQKLDAYLLKNEGSIQRQIIDLMVKHQIDIKELIELLKQNKKLSKGINGQLNAAVSPRKKSVTRPSTDKLKKYNIESSSAAKNVIQPYGTPSGYKDSI